jgi:ornithine--oxo-acid transaminase
MIVVSGKYRQEGDKFIIKVEDGSAPIMRFAPPLVITADQVDWALEEIGVTLRQDFS